MSCTKIPGVWVWVLTCLISGLLVFPTSFAAQESTPTTPVNEQGIAEAERVIVTGSNIPTAEEVGSNPVALSLRVRQASAFVPSHGAGRLSELGS